MDLFKLIRLVNKYTPISYDSSLRSSLFNRCKLLDAGWNIICRNIKPSINDSITYDDCYVVTFDSKGYSLIATLSIYDKSYLEHKSRKCWFMFELNSETDIDLIMPSLKDAIEHTGCIKYNEYLDQQRQDFIANFLNRELSTGD